MTKPLMRAYITVFSLLIVLLRLCDLPLFLVPLKKMFLPSTQVQMKTSTNTRICFQQLPPILNLQLRTLSVTLIPRPLL